MANIKISELNPLLTVEDADVLPIVDNAVTKKVTAAILRSYTQGNSVLLTGAQTVAGIKTFTSQLASSVATGTAPFSVASTTKVTNLNADLLDGLSSADFQATLSGTGIVKSTAGTISYLTDNSTNWNTAFNDSITSAAVTGTTTKTLTLNQQDGGSVTASWTDDNTDAVSSVFGRTGAVVAAEGDYSLTQLSDVTLTSPSNGQVLKYNGTSWINGTDLNSGTVTSVGMSVPTGLSVAGSPITTSGTLALSMAAGYSLPTDASQATWNTAYNDSIVSAGVTGTSTKTLTLNQQDGGTVTASWSDADTGLTSVGLSMPSAFTVSNSPLTSNGTIAVTGSGDTTQYIAGNGSLITFPVAGQSGTLVREVRNSTGATLTKGTVVYINGATGNRPTVTKAIATGDTTSAQTFGLLQADLTNNSNGFVVCIGDLSGLDTSSFTEGAQLYLSSTVAGAFTSVKQYAPNHLVYVGIVTRAHPTQGQIEVNIQNGYEMDELHNVSAQSPSNGDILQYVTSTSLWTKTAGTTTNISEGTNLYYTEARVNANTNVAANTAARHNAVTLGTANGLSLSTQALSLALASGSTTGALSSTDWSTFNNKQNALTNPITGTGTTNYLSKFTGTSALGNSLVYDNGTNVGIGTTTPDSTLTINGTGSSQIRLRSNDGNRGFLYVDGTEFALGTSTSIPLNIQTNGSTKLSITSAGNVGIGTTSPSYKFQTSSSVNSDWVGSFYNTSTTNPNGLQVRVGVSSSAQALGVYTDGVGYTFSVLGNGNTLIGTTTDGGYKLDVNGTARVSGAVQTRNLQIAGASGGYIPGDNPMIGFGNAPSTNDFGTIEAPFGDKMVFNQYHGYIFKTSKGGASPVPVFSIGINGTINFSSLPTSSAGLSAGDIWNDSGTLKIV